MISSCSCSTSLCSFCLSLLRLLTSDDCFSAAFCRRTTSCLSVLDRSRRLENNKRPGSLSLSSTLRRSSFWSRKNNSAASTLLGTARQRVGNNVSAATNALSNKQSDQRYQHKGKEATLAHNSLDEGLPQPLILLLQLLSLVSGWCTCWSCNHDNTSQFLLILHTSRQTEQCAFPFFYFFFKRAHQKMLTPNLEN